jgi:hypothetical protein
MASCSMRDCGDGNGRQRTPPTTAEHVAFMLRKYRLSIICWHAAEVGRRSPQRSDSHQNPLRRPGTTCFSEVVPQVVLNRFGLGDADQGGEVQVLTRQLNTFDLSVAAAKSIVQNRGLGHRDGAVTLL